LCVQTANVEQTREVCGQQIKNSIARAGIFPGGNESRGFVQHDREPRRKANKFAIYFNVVARGGLCAEVCADPAIDGDLACRYQLVTVPT
jgi:hypothetical protein